MSDDIVSLLPDDEAPLTAIIREIPKERILGGVRLEWLDEDNDLPAVEDGFCIVGPWHHWVLSVPLNWPISVLTGAKNRLILLTDEEAKGGWLEVVETPKVGWAKVMAYCQERLRRRCSMMWGDFESFMGTVQLDADEERLEWLTTCMVRLNHPRK